MNRLVVRTLSKNRLRILLHLPCETKRFERSSNETVEAFVNRIKSKLSTEVRTVALTDCRGTTVKKTVELCDALIPTNQFVFNDIVYEIVVDPPTIESLKIPNTPVAGWLQIFFVWLGDEQEVKILQDYSGYQKLVLLFNFIRAGDLPHSQIDRFDLK